MSDTSDCKVGDGLALGRFHVGRGPLPHLGDIGLGPSLKVGSNRAGLLPGLVHDAGRLGLGVGQLGLVVGLDLGGLGPLTVGVVDGVLDPLGALFHEVLHHREQLPLHQRQEDYERRATPDDLRELREDRIRCLEAAFEILLEVLFEVFSAFVLPPCRPSSEFLTAVKPSPSIPSNWASPSSSKMQEPTVSPTALAADALSATAATTTAAAAQSRRIMRTQEGRRRRIR